MYKETNVVDQKIEDFAEKWIDATSIKRGRILKVHAKDDNEVELVDAFFLYLLSPESLPDDIAIYFETQFKDKESFSKSLLEELETMLFEWNNSEKGVGIDFQAVEWKPDYTLESSSNSAKLFIKNINDFAESLGLDKDVKITPILRFYSNKTKSINNWLSDALSSEISPLVRLAICDTKTNSIFNTLSLKYPERVITLEPEADMDNILVQLAAGGDPTDPATPYRLSFVSLMQAIGKKDKRQVKEHGKKCIEIATDNIEKNPYWISQLIGLYMMLSNAYWGFKDKKKAFQYADSAVAVSSTGKEFLDSGIYYRQQGQAFLYRGSLFCLEKKWDDAIIDFKSATEAYEACNDYILQVESLRMEGYAAKKTWSKSPAIPLAQGARLGKLISPELIDASSYTFLIKQLLGTSYHSEISDDELNDILIPIWGDNWRDKLKKLSKQQNLDTE